VEIVVAEVGTTPDADQIYRVTYDGSVSDEPGFLAFGGEADQVAAELKERFSDGMTLPEALGAALAALAAPSSSSSATSSSGSSNSSSTGNGQSAEQLTAGKLEVAILDRARAHRTFRRLYGARLEELLAESRSSSEASSAAESSSAESSSSSSSSDSGDAGSDGDEPATGPAPGGGDGVPKNK
jgi:proteasome alpha subunit